MQEYTGIIKLDESAGVLAAAAGKRIEAANVTIEAALVFPVVFTAIVLMIACSFRLHDIIIGNLTANEAVELYGHLPEDGDSGAIESYGNSRLGAVLADTEYSLKLEEYKNGGRAELIFTDGIRVYEDGGSRPEIMMRRMTLIDGLIDDSGQD